jgi:hypothetical protein
MGEILFIILTALVLVVWWELKELKRQLEEDEL